MLHRGLESNPMGHMNLSAITRIKKPKPTVNITLKSEVKLDMTS